MNNHLQICKVSTPFCNPKLMRKIQHTPDARRQEKLEAFDRLLTIMDQLRENCPWDKKQTLESLRHLTIEETYELSDAILEQDHQEIKNELGDLMIHLAFYARIASETKLFDMADVIQGTCEKLIRRHPHIYGEVNAEDEEEVKKNWENIKIEEKGNRSVLAGVPQSLPALIKAMRMQEKVRAVGFDWEKKEQVWEKVEEEMQEFHQEFNLQNDRVDKQKATAEFGDLLFSLVNYARFVGIDPEEALERTNKKFMKRFQYLETQSAEEGKKLSEMTLEEMDKYWEEAKYI